VWLGLRVVDVPPSPKVHDHEVGDPVDWSVNVTGSGATPDVGEAEKAAVGAWGGGGGGVPSDIVLCT
jgi:hypothetical protein